MNKVMEFVYGCIIILIYPYIKNMILEFRTFHSIQMWEVLLIIVIGLLYITIYMALFDKNYFSKNSTDGAINIMLKVTIRFFCGMLCCTAILYGISIIKGMHGFYPYVLFPIPFTTFTVEWIWSYLKMILVGEMGLWGILILVYIMKNMLKRNKL